MAIVSGDLDYFLTGAVSDGAAQSDPDASLGGYRSSTEITSASDNNLFDDVGGAEASAGDTEYRCFVIKNSHGSLALTAAKVFVETDDGNSDTTMSLALERPATANATDGDAQTVANESTVPASINTTDHNGTGSGVTDWAEFSTIASYANGVSVDVGDFADGELDVGELIFVWVRRVIGSSASAADAVSFTIRIQGETAA